MIIVAWDQKRTRLMWVPMDYVGPTPVFNEKTDQWSCIPDDAVVTPNWAIFKCVIEEQVDLT